MKGKLENDIKTGFKLNEYYWYVADTNLERDCLIFLLFSLDEV